MSPHCWHRASSGRSTASCFLQLTKLIQLDSILICTVLRKTYSTVENIFKIPLNRLPPAINPHMLQSVKAWKEPERACPSSPVSYLLTPPALSFFSGALYPSRGGLCHPFPLGCHFPAPKAIRWTLWEGSFHLNVPKSTCSLETASYVLWWMLWLTDSFLQESFLELCANGHRLPFNTWDCQEKTGNLNSRIPTWHFSLNSLINTFIK